MIWISIFSSMVSLESIKDAMPAYQIIKLVYSRYINKKINETFVIMSSSPLKDT